MPQLAKPPDLDANGQPDYGLRADMSRKGLGFLGPLQRPDGQVSTELSMGTTDVTGKETEIPLLVPTLEKGEIDYLLSAPPGDWQHPTMKRIAGKAIDFARQRQSQGKPFFATDEESPKPTQSGRPPDLDASGQPEMNFAIVNGERVSVSDTPLDLVAGAAHTLNPIPSIQGLGEAMIPAVAARATGAQSRWLTNNADFREAIKGVLHAQGAVKAKGDQALQQGDYLSAARHYVDWLLPVIGPAIDKAADEAQQGRPWRGAGEAIGLALGMTAPSALKNAQVKVPAVAKNPNPAEAAAVEFGQARGIPVDAGTATGNRFVQGVQALADTSPLGGQVASRARQAQGEGLARVGGELAQQVHPSPVTPEQAGTALRAGTEDLIRSLDASADTAYGKLRALETSPTSARTVSTRSRTIDTGLVDAQGKPLTRTQTTSTQVLMPVDLRAAKEGLSALYTRLKREAELVPLMGDRARALVAVDRLMTGPDFAPVSVVDGALSDIKAMARGAAMPELRTKGQGVAAQAVQALEGQVQAAVRRSGPEAVQALEQGRLAVKTKWEVADALDAIKAEPVKAYQSAVAPKDTAIGHLRELAKVAPDVLPQVGRAWLEDALRSATAEGGFQKAARLEADWQRLGPQTKALLFGATAGDLDRFFLLAKKLAESPNPSGTALTIHSGAQLGLVFTNPLLGVPTVLGSAALSKILRTPRAVKALTQGMSRSVGSARASKTLQAIAAADVVRAAREAGIDLATLPKAADAGDIELPPMSAGSGTGR